MSSFEGHGLCLEHSSLHSYNTEFKDLSDPDELVVTIRQILEGRADKTYTKLQVNGEDPIITFEFGPTHSLGTITFLDTGVVAPMGRWLRREAPHSLARRFLTRDNKEFRWSYRDSEYECIACPSGYPVASYMKHAKSGATLFVEKNYEDKTIDLIASLVILLHIVRYRLNV